MPSSKVTEVTVATSTTISTNMTGDIASHIYFSETGSPTGFHELGLNIAFLAAERKDAVSPIVVSFRDL